MIKCSHIYRFIRVYDFTFISHVISMCMYLCDIRISSGYFKLSGGFPLTMKLMDLEENDYAHLWFFEVK